MESKEECTLRCLSWNTLAHCYYKSHGNESWESRRTIILEKLLTFYADIVLLQEVTLDNFKKDFEPLLDFYDYASHVISKKRTNPIGNVILWKRSRLSRKEVDIDHQNFIHCVLEIEGGGEIGVSNVHLKAGLRTGETERVSQIKSCLKHWCKIPTLPVLIGGDFNDDFSNTDALLSLLLDASFKGMDSPLPSCWHGDRFQPFDYILTRGECLSPGKPYTEGVLTPIPDDDTNPSDHLIIVTTILVIRNIIV